MAEKSAVVTGGGSGIGKGIATAFAADGYAVTVADINPASAEVTVAEIVAQGGRAQARTVDVSRSDQVLALLAAAAAFGDGVRAIVNAAGLWRGGTVLTIAEQDWDRVMEVNVKGLFWLARHGHPLLAASRGSITTIASVAGLKGTRSAGAYNPSKAAVIALTKNLALDFSADGIRANCICPGFVETPMGDAVLEFRGGGEELYRNTVKLHPLGRLGQPQDIAAAALYLASDGAAWVTGTSLVVDGGCMCGY